MFVIGDRVEDLTYLGAAPRQGKGRRLAGLWLCVCGSESVIVMGNIVSGNTKSCGCRRRKHGMDGTSIYRTWGTMIARCNNERHDNYPRYGGRGIKVCDRWMDFRNFYSDMGDKPSGAYQLDRIDNDGMYEPDNCQWVSAATNIRKKKATKLTEQSVKEIKLKLADGGLKLKDIAGLFNVSIQTVCDIRHGRSWVDV